jgi:hypothetical protein
MSLADRGFTANGKFAKGHRYFPADHHNVRKRQVTQQLISQLNEFCRDKRYKGKTNLEAVVEALIARALDGDVDAIREIFNRVDGKPGPALPLDEHAADEPYVFTLKVGDAK